MPILILFSRRYLHLHVFLSFHNFLFKFVYDVHLSSAACLQHIHTVHAPPFNNFINICRGAEVTKVLIMELYLQRPIICCELSLSIPSQPDS
jgi:hypothetical protein